MRFIDMQMKVTPTAAKVGQKMMLDWRELWQTGRLAQDVEKLKPRLEELQESLDRTVASMRSDPRICFDNRKASVGCARCRFMYLYCAWFTHRHTPHLFSTTTIHLYTILILFGVILYMM